LIRHFKKGGKKQKGGFKTKINPYENKNQK